MGAKLALLFVLVVALIQLFSMESNATVVKRSPTDAATTEKTDIEDTLNSVKKGVSEFLENIKNSEFFVNATKALDEFGRKVKEEGDQLMKKIQSNSSTTS